MAAMKVAKPTFPLKMWVQSDGTICWASAGTSHMWAGWMLAIATTKQETPHGRNE